MYSKGNKWILFSLVLVWDEEMKTVKYGNPEGLKGWDRILVNKTDEVKRKWMRLAWMWLLRNEKGKRIWRQEG